MHSTILFTLASGLALSSAQAPVPVPGVTGKLGPAKIIEGNPAGVSYIATLPDRETTTVRGSVVGTSNSNGTGVKFSISLSGLPDASLGPFSEFSISLTHTLNTEADKEMNSANAFGSVPHPRPARPL